MVNLTSIANVMTSWFSEFGSHPLHRTDDNSDDDVYDGYNDDGNQEDDCDFQNLALFLFTDLLVVAKRKSEERFVVLDYSPRNMIQVLMRRKKYLSAFQADEDDVLWYNLTSWSSSRCLNSKAAKGFPA